MALDLENKNQAYLCGRLFAILEKIQSDAIPGANSTIKERYYGAASTTPTTVFGRLLSLSRQNLIQGNLFIMKNYCKVLSLIWIVTGYLNIYRWTTSRVSLSVITIKEKIYIKQQQIKKKINTIQIWKQQ